MATLREEGIAENTLVFFTSDNGPWLIFGLHGGSAGLLRDVMSLHAEEEEPHVVIDARVMKHLRVLEAAHLVVTRRAGRTKLHFLNPVPIREIHDRWIDKYTETRASALADLKGQLEER